MTDSENLMKNIKETIRRLGYNYKLVNWYDRYTVMDVYNNKAQYCGAIWFYLDGSFKKGE